MTENEDSYSGWATFGKVAAGTLALGGLVTGIVFGWKAIYDSGYNHASYTLSREANEKAGQKLKELTNAGLVLPEDGCLRYSLAKDSDNTAIISCKGSSGEALELRVVGTSFNELTRIKSDVKSVIRPTNYGNVTLDRYVTKVEQQPPF